MLWTLSPGTGQLGAGLGDVSVGTLPQGWLASSGPSNILALEEVPVGCMGPRRAWTCSLVQCTDGVSAQVGELKSSPEAPIPYCPILALL